MAGQKTYNRHQALLGRRPSLLMALEPRILFDGAGADVIADVGADAFLPQDSGLTPEAPVAMDADAADAPTNDTAPSADASVNVRDAAPASGSDPAALTTPELSGQEQTTASKPGAASSADSAPSTDSTGAIADTVSDTVASVNSGTSPETNTDSGVSAGSDTATLNTDSPAKNTDQTEGILQLDPVDPVDPLATTLISQVVFVDTAVNDYQALVDGVINITDNDFTDTNPTGNIGTSQYTVSGSALVVTLGENPLADISATLANYTDLSAIHLVSHGDTGQVQIGGITISAQNLDQYSALFAGMGNALSESGDLLLYGCKVGADGSGQAFINAVAVLTQADVNASDDPTGNTASGGDWDLEVATGPIEATALLNEKNVANWQGTLELSGKSGWIALHVANLDPNNPKTDDTAGDTQASAADIISTNTQSAFYMKYDSETDNIAFRIRLNGDKNAAYSNVAVVGIDANADNRIDVLVGVAYHGNTQKIYIWNTDTGVSPGTTTFQGEYASWSVVTGSNYSYVEVSAVTDPDWISDAVSSADIDGNNYTDRFISFQLPFYHIKTYLKEVKNININTSSSLSFVFGTSNQANSHINSDLGFVYGSIGSNSTWEQIGAISQPVAPNPITVMGITSNSGDEGTGVGSANTIVHAVTLSGSDVNSTTTVNFTLAGFTSSETNYDPVTIGGVHTDISAVYYSFDNGATSTQATLGADGSFMVTVPKNSAPTFQIRIETNPDTVYENDEQYRLTAWTSANTSAVSGTGTIINDDALPLASIHYLDNVAVEGSDNNSVSFTVKLSHPSALDTDVYILPSTQNEINAADIADVSYTVFAANGETAEYKFLKDQADIAAFLANQVKITIPAYTTKFPVCTITFKDDDIYEQQETISFYLVEVTNAQIDEYNATAAATVYDEDGTAGKHKGDIPTLSIALVSDPAGVTEGDTAADTLTYRVSQDNLSNFDTTVLVKIDTSAGSAASAQDIAGIRYTDIHGDLVDLTSAQAIAAALTNGLKILIGKGTDAFQDIILTVKEDGLYEGDENLVLSLTVR